MDIWHAAGLGEAELLVQGDRTLVGIDDIGDHRLHVGIVGGDVHEGVEKLGAHALALSGGGDVDGVFHSAVIDGGGYELEVGRPANDLIIMHGYEDRGAGLKHFLEPLFAVGHVFLPCDQVSGGFRCGAGVVDGGERGGVGKLSRTDMHKNSFTPEVVGG